MNSRSDQQAMPLLVLTTCPDRESAERISQTLVSEGLAACVGQLPGMVSTYRWQGKLEQAREYQLLIKASIQVRKPLMERLAALHPYEVPELLIVNIDDGLPAYLQWLADESNPRDISE